MMAGVNLNAPALDMLRKDSANGIGAVAGPRLALGKARKDAEARPIEAEARSLALISDARARTQRFLVEPEEAGYGMLEIGPEGLTPGIEFQEKTRQVNVASVLQC